ncbi:MAG: hypothetical protein QNK23_15170 [Crocinitomicaceae bacterium]|nr:hypothetical protein [Crocinitomicaceae bacterium]
MKTKFLLLIMIGVLAFSCDKVASTQEKLTGVWTIEKYTFINYNSLSYIYPATGYMSFGSCEGSLCYYDIFMEYNNGVPSEKYAYGNIELLDEEKFNLHRTNDDGTVTVLPNNRIILLTKDELKLEFTDEIGLHILILEK